MRRHVIAVKSPCVANKCSLGAARSTIVASRPTDGSVTLPSVGRTGRCDGECIQSLQCSTREWLECAITPSVRRVIAGRFGQGKSGAAGDDAAVDYGEYRTYL
jgi:hypothetical protein